MHLVVSCRAYLECLHAAGMEGAGFKASIRRRFAQHRNTRATILTSSSLLAIFIASLISKGCVSDVRFTRSRPGLKGSRIRILVTSPRFAFLRETNVSFLLFSASEPHSFSSPFCLLSSFFFFPLFFFLSLLLFLLFLAPPLPRLLFSPSFCARRGTAEKRVKYSLMNSRLADVSSTP